MIAMIAVLVIETGQAWGDDNRFARTASDSIAPFLIV